jgi:WD40 repeat protein
MNYRLPAVEKVRPPFKSLRTASHGGPVLAVVVAELDSRPVIISGSRDDRTVRVWDLATGSPVGDRFVGHDGPVTAVAAAELDGRPVVISGSSDGTVRCGCGIWSPALRSGARRPATTAR